MDALDGMAKLNDETIDLIITDPPFGVEYKNEVYDDSKEFVFGNLDKWISEMSRVLKTHSHIYIYIPTLEIDKWVYTVKKYFNFKNILSASVHATNRYMKDNYNYDQQFIIYASKGKPKRLNKVNWIPTSAAWLNDKRNPDPKNYVYTYPARIPKKWKSNVQPNEFVSKLHPNQKSWELAKWFVLLSSEENDIVFDPFCGSGSFLISAKITGRKWIGLDQNTEKAEQARQRIRTFSYKEQQEHIGEFLDI